MLLFKSVVGSRLFGDETPKSDWDICEIYQVPTKTVLEGRPYKETMPQEKYEIGGRKYEATYWEIGHLVHQLIKGNQNAIWMTCSELLEFCHDMRIWRRLQEITKSNLSKASYGSIRGMCVSQWNDVEKRWLGIKGIRSAWRTANFGCILLKDGKVEFNKTPPLIDIDDLKAKMFELDWVYVDSVLPEKPNPEPFYEFMYDVREMYV